MRWRPEGWERLKANQYLPIKDVDGKSIAIFIPTERAHRESEIYEAGADALLEALKEAYGDKIKKDEWTDDYTFQTDSDGILISFLIPDYEEGKDDSPTADPQPEV